MAAYIFLVSVIKDIKNILDAINRSAAIKMSVAYKKGTNQKTANGHAINRKAKAQKKKLQTLKQFTIFIETHSNLKQLSLFY